LVTVALVLGGKPCWLLSSPHPQASSAATTIGARGDALLVCLVRVRAIVMASSLRVGAAQRPSSSVIVAPLRVMTDQDSLWALFRSGSASKTGKWGACQSFSTRRGSRGFTPGLEDGRERVVIACGRVEHCVSECHE
jgi:hypothetical protein